MTQFDTKNLTTLEGESFKTPTFYGDQTVFRFKREGPQNEKLFKGLMFTDYFRMPGTDGLKCHFTVYLKLEQARKKAVEDFQFVKISYNNPHLTVRTDLMASQHAGTKGVHMSCEKDADWSGNDNTIDVSILPNGEKGEEMWRYFQYELRSFVGLVESFEHNRHLGT